MAEFYTGCAHCNTAVTVKNFAWVVTWDGEGCADCQWCKDYETDPTGAPKTGPGYSGDEWPSASIAFGWCGCGNPEEVDAAFYWYLTSVQRCTDEGYEVIMFPYGLDHTFAYLLAYIADTAGWTEHGGSVGGAWLSDEGKSALTNLQRRFNVTALE